MAHIDRILQHLQKARDDFGPGVYTANEHNIPGLETLDIMDYLRFWDWHKAMERRRKREGKVKPHFVCHGYPWPFRPGTDALIRLYLRGNFLQLIAQSQLGRLVSDP